MVDASSRSAGPVTTAVDLGTVLGIWAHPDDEAYLSGGLMAEAVAAGNRVVCVTATRGEEGFPDDDPRSVDERAAVREAEMVACLEILGVSEHHWLDYRDGGCDEVENDEAASRLAALIDDVRPDTVLTFGPDGMTGHVDHRAVSRWTTRALDRINHAEPALLYATNTAEWATEFMALVDPGEVMMVEDMDLPIVEPHELAVWLKLEHEFLTRKVEALHCQASQVDGLAAQVGDHAFRRLNGEEFFRPATPADWPT
jgi:LmbE family N-acetylglucosaminyl deacetylase